LPLHLVPLGHHLQFASPEHTSSKDIIACQLLLPVATNI
jgi:hypothetical protein